MTSKKTSTSRSWLPFCLLALACGAAPRALSPQPPAPPAPAAPAQPWAPTPPPGPLAQAPARAPAVTQLELANGLRVVVVEQHRRPIVSVRLAFPRGSLSEEREDAGLTFLAVALLTDYYEKNSEGRRIAFEKSFRRRVSLAGGAAFFDVGPDSSLLGIDGFAQESARYLKLLSEAVLVPRHGMESFVGRRNALLDALEDLEISDSSSFDLFLKQLAFGADHPYARPVYGRTESLERLGLENVTFRQQELLTPRGATLLVVGDVDPAAVVAQARGAFGPWRGRSVARDAVQPPSIPKRKPEVSFIPRQPASTLIACATRPLTDVRGGEAALDLLAAALGSGGGSRLNLVLREQHGLTYGAQAAMVKRRHARAWVACAHLRADKAEEGLGLFLQVLDSVRGGALTAEELEHARALLVAEVEATHDSTGGSVSAWLEAIDRGDGTPKTEARRAELERVTLEEVQALARRVLAPETTRWILSGEHQPALRAARGNGLGRLQGVTLQR
jgi:predicted Zn-dependent peptidase